MKDFSLDIQDFFQGKNQANLRGKSRTIMEVPCMNSIMTGNEVTMVSKKRMYKIDLDSQHSDSNLNPVLE